MTARRVQGSTIVLDEGIYVGEAQCIDFIGADISASLSGSIIHVDVSNSGSIDSSIIIVSGSSESFPNYRRFVAGQGIIVSDNPTEHTLTVSIDPAYSGFTHIQWNEVPSGTLDGLNKIYTTSLIPSPSNSLMFFVNGVLQKQNSDYVLSASTITLLFSPHIQDNLLATYQY